MYEKGNTARVLGCLVPLVGTLSVVTCAFQDFFDASSKQSSAECKAAMLRKVLAKVEALPEDSVLKSKNIVIEHELRGNREQTEPLAAILRALGKSIRVDSLEVGTNLVIQDRPQSFRKFAQRRLTALCNFAAEHHLQYDSWWVSGDRYSDYVSQ